MEKGQTKQTKREPSLGIGILGCVGGMFIQLVIGSLYQWGIVNIYVTSYYKLFDDGLTLQQAGIIFPLMMVCMGLTMRLGLYLSQKFHPLIVLGTAQFLQALFILISSFMPSFWTFILFYGLLFGFAAGNNFMVPIHELNNYMVGNKMIVNGIVLMGTGLGSVVFGEFSFNVINPEHLSPNNGYYIGTPALQEIAMRLPVIMKWLALLYLIISILGVSMIAPVCLHNQRVKNQRKKQLQQQEQLKTKKKDEALKPVENSELKIKKDEFVNPQKNTLQKEQNEFNILDYVPDKNEPKKPQEDKKQAESIKQALKSKVFWISLFALFFGAAGCFMVSGNYKTYVKKTIQDDQFLTLIGVIGAVGNGCSRFFWNVVFSKTGYKTVVLSILTISICVFSTIRFTTSIKEAYLVQIFLTNVCLGGFLVTTPTVLQYIYGQNTGANIYGLFWQNFAIGNLISYVYVSQVSTKIGFDNIVYIVLGMCVIAIPVVILTTFKGHWNNETHQLEYFVHLELKKAKKTEIKPQSNGHLGNHEGEHKVQSTHSTAAPKVENQDSSSIVAINYPHPNTIKLTPIKN